MGVLWAAFNPQSPSTPVEAVILGSIQRNWFVGRYTLPILVFDRIWIDFRNIILFFTSDDSHDIPGLGSPRVVTLNLASVPRDPHSIFGYIQ